MRKKSYKIIVLTFICLGFSALQAYAADKDGIAVMELFTSQGCSSCPPADRLMDEIDARYGRAIMTLGCHVTDWDSPAWQDTTSRIFCDARQSAYRQSGVIGRVYTPEVVVNGRYEAVGNDEDQVKDALAKGGPLPSIHLMLREQYLDITLPQMKLEKSADIWLVSYGGRSEAHVRGGENSGKTALITHPVKNITKLMAWDGRAVSMSFPLQDVAAESYGVIAQSGDGPILAAGKTKSSSP